MAQEERPKILVALDESDHSFYALEWTLDHLIIPFGSSPPFQILLIHGQPTPSSALGLAGPGSAEVMPIVEVDLKKTATKIMNRAKDLCISKGINEKELGIEVMEGDPRNVACEAVDKHHATILVLGSHGYGAMKRAVLGSVSDYCAHHAQCTVMIVKKPKVKI
ncbi:hypothetical protein SLEP1_g40175 [Rubroshorea leprosula]|uniref:UspA domain-containing protein n=1 Tax=Rubroshorea leprosula TaxID=152421 RepID=A0AAV5L2S5_9ROSI|nr:hypothetical protein SLEP1_g40175 [Rubroshorea leprosula]